MKIQFIQIDKTDDQWIKDGMEKYIQRLKHYCQLDIQTIEISKSIRAKTQQEQKIEEGKQILKVSEKSDMLILLDEKGKKFSSAQFATYLENMGNRGYRQISFVIGGPYGFSQEVYQKCKEQISLSDMTFSHQMVRVFFLEQVYRAFTILKGEKYHHP